MLLIQVFKDILDGQEESSSALVRISVLAETLCAHPDVVTWYASFGEPQQTGLQVHEVLQHEVDFEKENTVGHCDSNNTCGRRLFNLNALL